LKKGKPDGKRFDIRYKKILAQILQEREAAGTGISGPQILYWKGTLLLSEDSRN
jgi:hypothetical protein